MAHTNSPYHSTTVPILGTKDSKDKGYSEAIYLFRQISQK